MNGLFALLVGLICIGSVGEEKDGMHITTRPLVLDVIGDGPTTTLIVAGSAPELKRVRYSLVVEGQSYTRHAGSATLYGERQIISRVRLQAGERWTATLMVEAEGNPPYRLVRTSAH
jgi:hypothetical protein